MTYLRRLILALALSAGLAPAFAQVPPPVPALPDTERRTSYSISASTCACSVGFALYGDSTDYANWIEVFVNGVRMTQAGNWTLSSATGTIGSIPLPITNAVLTFTAPQTGTIQIVGARRPRRTSQFNEGTGVPTRNFNVVLSDLTAQNRELWDKTNDVTGRALLSQPGNTVGLLPLPATCASKFLGFDATGLIPQCSAGGPGSGNVTGPLSTVVGNAALWNNTIGSLLSDAGSPPVLTSQLGTSVAAFLATPSSANLRAAITDETGTGLAYFQNGALGTPVSGIATNLTGTAAGLTVGNVAGGTATGLTGFGIRSTAAAFDLRFASNEVFTADRTLSWTLGDTNRAITLGGNVSTAGAFTMSGAFGFTGTLTALTAVTYPTAGTLATLAGTEVFTNKTVVCANQTSCVVRIGTDVSGLGAGNATMLGVATGSAGGPTQTIASGTSALGTGAITSATCASVVTTAATNTATTDVVTASFNGDPTAVTGYIPSTSGMLTIISYPTANNVNFKVCNNTLASITPGAITVNWRVVR